MYYRPRHQPGNLKWPVYDLVVLCIFPFSLRLSDDSPWKKWYSGPQLGFWNRHESNQHCSNRIAVQNYAVNLCWWRSNLLNMPRWSGNKWNAAKLPKIPDLARHRGGHDYVNLPHKHAFPILESTTAAKRWIVNAYDFEYAHWRDRLHRSASVHDWVHEQPHYSIVSWLDRHGNGLSRQKH